MYRHLSKSFIAFLVLYTVPLAATAQSADISQPQLSATEQILSAQPPFQPPSNSRQQSSAESASGFGTQFGGQPKPTTKTPPVPQQQVGTHRQTIQLPPTGGRNLNLPRAGFSTLSNRGGGLPPTRLDSFVFEAGGSAELIYGDEGDYGPPPFFGFSSEHHIEAGIHSGGLTTGHRSGLPEAWGYPE